MWRKKTDADIKHNIHGYSCKAVLGLAAMLIGSAAGFFAFAMTVLASGGELRVDLAGNQKLAGGYYKIASDGTKTEGTQDDYNVHYDPSTHTLTLKNLKFQLPKEKDGVGIRFTYSGTNGAAVIELIGENEITSSNLGIYAWAYGSEKNEESLTIKGSGTLKINAERGMNATNLVIDGSTLDITTRKSSALRIYRDLTIRNAYITTHDTGDGGDFYVDRSLQIINSNIDMRDIKVKYPALYLDNLRCSEEILVKPAAVIENSSLEIGGDKDGDFGFSLYVSQGGAKISDAVLKSTDGRAGIAVADGALELSGNSSVSTGECVAVRTLGSAKIGEGVEITGVLAEGKPLINNGLICMPDSVTGDVLNSDLHYYGGGTVKLGDKTYHSVRFDLQDGTQLDAIETQWILDGERAAEPSDPQKEGAGFTGWTEAGAGIWDFSQNPITKSMVFLAGWKQEDTGNTSQPSSETDRQTGSGSGTGSGGASGSTDSTEGAAASGSRQTGRHKPGAGEPEDGDLVPFIKGDNGKEGWEVIREETAHTEEGGTVIVDMNGTVIVPGDVLNDIKGRDITMVFDMGGRILWSINGQSITNDRMKDIDFSVKLHADTIPVEVINQLTGERYSIQLDLAHEGAFGLTAILSVNVGEKNAGLYANLFHYQEAQGEMEFICADEISEDGTAELTFTHASAYAAVIDTKPANAEEGDEVPEKEMPENDDKNETAPETAAEEKAGNYWPVLVAGVIIVMGGAGYFFVRKKKKETEI